MFLPLHLLALAFDPLHRADDRRAAGDADVEAFFGEKIAGHEEGFFVFDLDHVVDDGEIVVLRDEVFADAFDLVGLGHGLEFSGLEIVVNDRADWIDGDDLHGGFLFLEVLADAADRAAGADARDDGVDVGELLEDLGAGRRCNALRGWRDCRTGSCRSRSGFPARACARLE